MEEFEIESKCKRGGVLTQFPWFILEICNFNPEAPLKENIKHSCDHRFLKRTLNKGATIPAKHTLHVNEDFAEILLQFLS